MDLDLAMGFPKVDRSGVREDPADDGKFFFESRPAT